MPQHITINPALIVSHPLGQSPGVADLHVNFIHHTILVLGIDIETNSPTNDVLLHGLLKRGKLDPINPQFWQDDLNQMLAEMLVAHYTAENKVLLNTDPFHNSSSRI